MKLTPYLSAIGIAVLLTGCSMFAPKPPPPVVYHHTPVVHHQAIVPLNQADEDRLDQRADQKAAADKKLRHDTFDRAQQDRNDHAQHKIDDAQHNLDQAKHDKDAITAHPTDDTTIHP